MTESDSDLRAQAQQHRAAGEAAEQDCRWQEATEEYERCLSAIAQADAAADEDEGAVLVALGRCYWNLSQARTAWRTLRRAISLYQQRNDGIGQARATIEILRIWGPPERHIQMANDALQALGDADPYLRARLLFAHRWFDEHGEEKYREAMALADEHGFEDLLTSRVDQRAWDAYREGRIDDGTAGLVEAHETYARLRIHDPASGALRGACFNMIEFGRLDEGYALAERAFAYSSKVNLHFSAQLALMDMAGVVFARGDFDACEAVVASAPTSSDFRGDLYRMWMAERRGDIDGALQLMVNPDRAGGAPTAVGQVHAASAGLLYRSGREDAAAQALRAWADVERRPEDESWWMEAPAFHECLLALADDALLRRVHHAFQHRLKDVKASAMFSTLQGRAVAPLIGGVCLRLGLVDEAQRHYSEGLAWCERERCAHDASLCRAGLDEVRQRS